MVRARDSITGVGTFIISLIIIMGLISCTFRQQAHFATRDTPQTVSLGARLAARARALHNITHNAGENISARPTLQALLCHTHS